MKINFQTCSEKELWEYVAVHLKNCGIDTVLVGGAVVSIYSKGAYHSGDLDFVKTSLFVTKLEESMNEIWFKKHGRHYIPSGPPLGIGEDNAIIPDEVEVKGTIIKILSPTDCVKDRLASYIHFKAPEGLDQAVLVSKNQNVNLRKIKIWCKNEKAEWAFDDFLKKLKS